MPPAPLAELFAAIDIGDGDDKECHGDEDEGGVSHKNVPRSGGSII